MKNYQKNILKLFIIYCFFYPSHSTHASQSLSQSAQMTTYRIAHRLCYAATYYRDQSSYFDQRIQPSTFRQPYIDDFRFREGIDAWLSIDRISLYSAFKDWIFSGGSERKFFFSNMNQVNEFVNESRFEDAIRDCAEERGLVFEDLLENMRSTILRVDSRANWFARILQLYAIERVSAFVFPLVLRGIIGTFRMIGSGVRALTPPQVRSFVSQTRGAQAVKRQAEFVQNNKARTALGVVGVPLLSVTTVGHGVQIDQENQNVQIYTKEEMTSFADELLKTMDHPIGRLWSRRWFKSGNIIQSINTMIRTFEEGDLGQYRGMIRIFEESDNSTQYINTMIKIPEEGGNLDRYRGMIRKLEKLDLDHLNADDLFNEIYTNHRDLAIHIDLHFIDYWFVNRKLNESRLTKEVDHPDTLALRTIEELFNRRKRQLENQPHSSEKAVALELLDLTKNNEFLCSFNNLFDGTLDDTHPNLLCKTHLFYTITSGQSQYRGMIRTFEEWDLNHLNEDDLFDEIYTNHRDLAIRIDLYFVDYWFVSRQLHRLMVEEGEDHPDTGALDIIEGFFDFRRRQLEDQPPSPEKVVALELLDLSRDNEFLCPFSYYNDSNFLDDNDTRPNLLCKIHFFYTKRRHNYNGELSPKRALQLQQLEAKLANL